MSSVLNPRTTTYRQMHPQQIEEGQQIKKEEGRRKKGQQEHPPHRYQHQNSGTKLRAQM